MVMGSSRGRPTTNSARACHPPTSSTLTATHGTGTDGATNSLAIMSGDAVPSSPAANISVSVQVAR